MATAFGFESGQFVGVGVVFGGGVGDEERFTAADFGPDAAFLSGVDHDYFGGIFHGPPLLVNGFGAGEEDLGVGLFRGGDVNRAGGGEGEVGVD